MTSDLKYATLTHESTGHGAGDAPPTSSLDNKAVADRLEEIAELLDAQNANVFRVRAYRNAAQTVRELTQPIEDILADEGSEGLTRLPGIGRSLARSIQQLAHTGRLPLLSQLRGDGAVERVLATVPGIGREMAARIHETIGIETLAELLAAAWDGRLAQVPGMGRGRIRAVRESLAGRLRTSPRAAKAAAASPSVDETPPVAELLEVDEEYRRKAERDQLPRIAPRRFNPTGAAWLPILHTHRGQRHYTALYSNTARAHEFGTVRDWVVIYRDDEGGDGQWTVITSRFGKLKGRRIVRGREVECDDYYAAPSAAAEHGTELWTTGTPVPAVPSGSLSTVDHSTDSNPTTGRNLCR